MKHNLAPLATRRDIAMLALLHKCALGVAHPDLIALFPLQEPPGGLYTRLQKKRHEKQFVEPLYAPKTDYM